MQKAVPRPGVTLTPLKVVSSSASPIYRLFLRSAIAWGATLGFTLGAVLLLTRTIGMPADLGWAWWVGDVQTHGALQLFGWMTFTLMGVGLHILPRFHGVPPVSRRQGLLLFGSLFAGLIFRVAAHIGGFLFGPTIVTGALGLLSGGLVLAASSYFAALVISIVRRSARPDGPPSAYVVAAALWLSAGALLSAGQMLYLGVGQHLIIPDAYNEPVLHTVLVGFGIQFTLGMSQRILPGWPGLAPLPRWLAAAIWAAFNAGLALRTAGLLLAGAAAMPVLETVARAGALAAALALVMFAVAIGPWRSPQVFTAGNWRRADIYTAVAAAYGWLLVAGLLEAGMAVRALAGTPPGYFEVSAVRHAFALGFLTLMVMGMASRMVPAFGGTQLVWPTMYRAAIWLVLASVTLRVPLTLAAGLLPPEAAAVNGLSGILGASGFGLWGICVWRTLNHSDTPASHCPRRFTGTTANPSVAAVPQSGGGVLITASMTPANAIEQYPETLPVFVRFGFAALQNAQLRSTLGKVVTIGQAAAMQGVNGAELVEELNRAAQSGRELGGSKNAPISR